jgi:filamentous hemagglutinin family protein
MTPVTTPARSGWTVSLGGLAVAVALLHGWPAWAQNITVDGRLSAARTLAGPNYAIEAELGRRVGGNLFHSFGRFGLNTGETATFSGPAGVANVVGRVTGGAASSIDGTVRSAIPGANLYLVNPAGVVFGPNARVDVSGAFHASSADYIRMRDGARFQATDPDASTLSAAPPEAFGFLSAAPGRVVVDGATLQGAPGRALGLVGGPVTISGGTLSAPAGTVHIASAAGPGEAPVDPRAGAGPAPTVGRFGPVRVEGGSRIAVGDAAGRTSGGSVFVRAGELSIAASAIDADNHGPGPGGVVSLRGDGAVVIRDQADPDQPMVRARALAAGQGPGVNISTAAGGSVVVDAAAVEVGSLAAGPGGELAITGGSLAVRNGAAVRSTVRGSGDGGPVSIGMRGEVSLTDGAIVGSTVFGEGRGGVVSLNAGGNLVIDSGASRRLTGIVGGSDLENPGAGSAGTIAVAARDVALRGLANIISNAPAPARGSTVSVAATGDLVLDARGGGEQAVIAALTLGRGNGGSVAVAARNATMLGNSIVFSGTNSFGSSGAVTVSAQGDLLLGAAAGAQAQITSGSVGIGNAGPLTVDARNITLQGNARLVSGTEAGGNGGAVTVNARGDLVLDGRQAALGSRINAYTGDAGDAGPVTVNAGDIAILGNAAISSTILGSGAGRGQSVDVTATGSLRIDGQGADGSSTVGIATNSFGSGDAGSLGVGAHDITVRNGGAIASNGAATQRDSLGRPVIRREGAGGDVTVTAAGALTLDRGSHIDADTYGSRAGGAVTVSAASIGLLAGSYISSSTGSTGSAGTVAVKAGSITLQGGSQIASTTAGTEAGRGDAGTVTVQAGALDITGASFISSGTYGSGNGRDVTVDVAGALVVDGSGAASFTGIDSQTEPDSSGNAGSVVVRAGGLALRDGGGISSTTLGTGVGGSVTVAVAGDLLVDGQNSAGASASIAAESSTGGKGAGTVAVSAGSITLRNGGLISSSTFGGGGAGAVTVRAGAITVEGGPGFGGILSATTGSGRGGEVSVGVAGGLSIVGNGDTPGFVGITGQTESTSPDAGPAGKVTVRAGTLALSRAGVITSGTLGAGKGGEVVVEVGGALTIDGRGGAEYLTGIANQTERGSTGDAGSVFVRAGSLAIRNAGSISSSTRGLGAGGSVLVSVDGDLVIDAQGARALPTGIQAQIDPTYPEGRAAGRVDVSAANIVLRDGGVISTSTAGRGNAGAVAVHAGTIAVQGGAQIASSTSGPGDGGSVVVTTPGALSLDGLGVPGTQIAASATEQQSGKAGSVVVDAGSITIQGGAQIASTTASRTPPNADEAGARIADATDPGFCAASGNVCMGATGDIRLSDPGSAIATNSTGTRPAGSIRMLAPRVILRDEASVSTAAQTADGGAITIGRGDLLHLQNSRITTSVAAESGNGGDIAVDPRFVVLDRSAIRADARAGSGGNVRIRADQFVRSAFGSDVSAFSELGVSGTITITGPPLNLNGSLVVLASELRAAAALLREGCAARGGSPRSSLVVAGRGGRRQGAAAAEASLPALYIAHRPVRTGGDQASETAAPPAPVRTSVGLSSRCG